jgi:hypothetical protein
MAFGYERKKKLRELALHLIEVTAYRKERPKVQTKAIAEAKKKGIMRARGKKLTMVDGKPFFKGLKKKGKLKKFSSLF